MMRASESNDRGSGLVCYTLHVITVVIIHGSIVSSMLFDFGISDSVKGFWNVL